MKSTASFADSFPEIVQELYHAALLKTGDEAQAKFMVRGYIDALFTPGGMKRRKFEADMRAGIIMGNLRNPRPVMIYSDVISLRATKAGMKHSCDEKCRVSGHRYEHKFKPGSAVFGSSDRKMIIIKSRK